jgi:hypothetical protein
MAYSESLGLVLLAGSDASTSGAVSGAMTFDVATGEVMVLPPGPRQMSRARAHASVTPFGAGFLVAGGEDPTITFDSGRRNLHDTAEVYDPEAREFEDELIELINPRSRHRAIVLPNGDTALIGGLTESALGERTAPTIIEFIHVLTRGKRPGPQLDEARVDPTVLRLSDARILVAGGETLKGELVESLEWRTADLQKAEMPENAGSGFQARFDQAFAAMPGGSVLAVGGCQDREGDDEDCDMCRRGCRPESGWDAFFIDARGKTVSFTLEFAAPEPMLIEASDGSPWLATEENGTSVLRRFNPWARSFQLASSADEPSPQAHGPVVAIDGGAYLYVVDSETDARLWGRRFDTRNAFSHNAELVRVTHPSDSTWPLHLAPGSAVGSVTGLVPSGSPPAPWVLELDGAQTAWITDTRSADFDIELELAPGGPPELLAGGRVYSWPAHEGSRARVLSALRRENVVTLSAQGETHEFTIGAGRTSLGLKAGDPDQPVRLTRLSVSRGEP